MYQILIWVYRILQMLDLGGNAPQYFSFAQGLYESGGSQIIFMSEWKLA